MFEYKEEYRHIHSVCLNLTDACNLRCRYCFVAQQPHFMTYQVAQDAVDFLVSNLRWKKEHGLLKDNDKTKINFFGGEPMLLWDEVIVPLTKYCKEEYPDETHLSMTTNGTLLNKERIDFMKENNFGLLLSIDGDKETQDYNRPCGDPCKSSFDMVSANIPYILQNFPNVTFRATIDQATVKNVFKDYLFAQYQGFKNIFMIPNGREQWSEENIQILKDEIAKIYAFRVQSYRLGLPVLRSSPIDDSFKRVREVARVEASGEEVELKVSRSIHRCGMGLSYGSIGYDGSIYACQEQDSREHSTIFYMGNIYEGGVKEEYHRPLLEAYQEPKVMMCEDPTLCDHCPMRKICFNRCCPSTSMDLFGDMHIDNKMHCVYNQTLYENAEKTYAIFSHESSPYFNSYIENNIMPKKKKKKTTNTARKVK